jgi:hypothetical protein
MTEKVRIKAFVIALTLIFITPSISASLEGNITDVVWPTKEVYGYFESVPVQVNFTNTGSETCPFWLVYFVQDSSGRTWSVQEAIYTARLTPPIRPGGNCSATISWSPLDNAPEGGYTAVLILCKNYENGYIKDELDRKTKLDAFQLEKSLVLAQKFPFSPWSSVRPAV